MVRRTSFEGLAGSRAGAIDDQTCCPGADTCDLVITHSRRLAPRLAEKLRAADRVTEILGDAVNLTEESILEEDLEDLDTGVPSACSRAGRSA